MLFTMHATIMIFCSDAHHGGGFGPLDPDLVGANDMAFPVLNMLSFWTAVPLF
jgi:cytochrome c oxidase subunit 1